jgi:hypothetical protein
MGEGTIRGLSLQIRYKWTDGAPARGAYHSLAAPVHTIPLVQIRAPLDICSFIHNTVDSGKLSGLYPSKILQKREDKGIMKGKGRKERVREVIFRDLYWNRKIKTITVEVLKGGTVSTYYRPRFFSAYVVP